MRDVLLGLGISAAALILLALGIRSDWRRDRKPEPDLLAPHAGWLEQHECDRRFRLMIAAEWAEVPE